MVSLLVLAGLQVENKPASIDFQDTEHRRAKQAIDSLKLSLRFTRDGISAEFCQVM